MAGDSSRKAEKRAKNEAKNRVSDGSFGFLSEPKWILGLTVAGVAILALAVKGIFVHNANVQKMADEGGKSNVPRGPNKLPIIDVTETDKLKEVFLSGNPHVVHCVSENTLNEGTPDVVNDLYTQGMDGVKFAFINCWKAMESGKTIADRFKVPRFDPVTVSVANNATPKVLKTKNTVEGLMEAVTKNIVPQPVKIDSLQKWDKHCRHKARCIIISGKKGARREEGIEAAVPVMEKYRNIKVVEVDTGYWQVKLEDDVINTRPDRAAEDKFLADAVCIAKTEKETGNEFHGQFLQAWDEETVQKFFADCQVGNDGTWADQMFSVDIIHRDTLKAKKPTEVSADDPNETSTKRDHVGGRDALEDVDVNESDMFGDGGGGDDEDEEEVEI